MRAPDSLRPFRDFLIWRTEAPRTPGAKMVKVPMHWDGVTRHSTANPAPPLSAEEAEQWLEYLRSSGVGHADPQKPGYVGMGFRPSPRNGIVCLDLDDQLDSPLMQRMNGAGYEISINGSGLHVWGTHRESARIGRRGQVATSLGKMELYGDGQFIALGTWLAGSAQSDCTEVFDQIVTEFFPAAGRANTAVTAPDWESKTEQQRTATVADLRAALRFLDMDSREVWVATGQALVCLGDLGRQLWTEWSAASTRFPGGADLEKWDTFSGERSDYRAVFAKAAVLGWANPARAVLPETVFKPMAPALVAPTPAGAAAVKLAVERLQAEPTEETLRQVGFDVARLGAGGQLDWQGARAELAAAAPWADTAVLDVAEAKARLAPLTASAQATIQAEQGIVSSQVGWLREAGMADAGAVLNDRALALRMFESCPGELRHLSSSDDWICWEDGRWVTSHPKHVRDKCMRDVPLILVNELQALAGIGAIEYLKTAVKAASVATAGNVTDALAYLPGVPIDNAEINADPMLCGMNGGRRILDLRTGAVREALFGDYVTLSLGVESVGEASKAVRWKQFLNEVFLGDEELIEYMHRFCGYMLTGSVREHVFLFLFGSGSNGKSVFTKVIEALMGQYGNSLQPATLCDDKRSGSGPSADLASIAGMRLVTSAEADEGSRFADSLLKGLVAGDKMPVRKLYGMPFDMVPVLKLVLTGNNKPTIRGTDDGIWRRVRLVPFKAKFGEGKGDPRLELKLKEELPHILAWAIEGCLKWDANGLGPVPAVVKEATAEYRNEMDILGQWLEDECIQGGQFDRVVVATLYSSYLIWAGRNGIKAVWTASVFGKKLTEYNRNGWCIGQVKESHVRYRNGISLMQAPGSAIT